MVKSRKVIISVVQPRLFPSAPKDGLTKKSNIKAALEFLPEAGKRCSDIVLLPETDKPILGT